MKHECNYYGKIITTLHKLKEVCPSCTMGKHISTITEDMGDLWAVSDREFSQALDNYAKELIIDKPHGKDDIEHIIEEGLHLDRILIDDDMPVNDDEY